MQEEMFKTIEDFPDYQVSNFGNVLSNKYVKKRLLKQRVVAEYKRVNLYKNKKMFTGFVARLVCKTFIDNPENKPEVNHKNGNKLDNNVENLEWNTCSENRLHMFKTGLKISQKGESHGRSKLKENEVVEILKSKERQSVLAKKYNVTQGLITSIKSGKIWKHLIK